MKLLALWIGASLIVGLLRAVAPQRGEQATFVALTAYFVVGVVLMIPAVLTGHLLCRRS